MTKKNNSHQRLRGKGWNWPKGKKLNLPEVIKIKLINVKTLLAENW